MVSLKQVIETVLQKGVLDIGILTSAMPYFLPPLNDHELSANKPGDSENRQRVLSGFLDIETSSGLLSHRPSSRPSDDIVSWNLLINDQPKRAKVLEGYARLRFSDFSCDWTNSDNPS